jgi:hypothetical protein
VLHSQATIVKIDTISKKTVPGKSPPQIFVKTILRKCDSTI